VVIPPVLAAEADKGFPCENRHFSSVSGDFLPLLTLFSASGYTGGIQGGTQEVHKNFNTSMRQIKAHKLRFSTLQIVIEVCDDVTVVAVSK